MVHDTVDRNTKVLLRDGRSTSLYFNIWYCTESIASILWDNELDSTVKVSDMLINNAWQLQGIHVQNLLRSGMDLNNLPVPQGGEDCRVWMSELTGQFLVRSAKQLIRKKYAEIEVYCLLWRAAIHPNLATQNWKIVRKACATQDKLQNRFKFYLPNKCYFCKADEETLEHILWN